MAISLPFTGKEDREAVRVGFVTAYSNPTRASLRSTGPPHEGEGKYHANASVFAPPTHSTRLRAVATSAAAVSPNAASASARIHRL